jgi:hypothetical protein
VSRRREDATRQQGDSPRQLAPQPPVWTLAIVTDRIRMPAGAISALRAEFDDLEVRVLVTRGWKTLSSAVQPRHRYLGGPMA